MDHYIKVKEIEIKDPENAGLIECYPESGFWLAKTKRTSDLRFVDKEANLNFCICPEQIYKGMGIDTPVIPEQEGITNLSTFINTPPGYVSEEFVMGFAKMLLNGKR